MRLPIPPHPHIKFSVAAACVTLAVPEIFVGLERLKISTAAPFAISLFPPQEALAAKLPIPPHPHIKFSVAAACVTLAVPEIFVGLERLKISTAAPFAISLFPPQEALAAKLPIPPHPHIKFSVAAAYLKQ